MCVCECIVCECIVCYPRTQAAWEEKDVLLLPHGLGTRLIVCVLKTGYNWLMSQSVG